MSNVILGRNDMGLVLETVNAQGAAGPFAPSGSKSYKFLLEDGVDSSGGPVSVPFAGAVVGDRVVFFLQFVAGVPGSSAPSGSPVYEDTISVNDQIQQIIAFSQVGNSFLVVLQSS